jgi:hypothetical protein
MQQTALRAATDEERSMSNLSPKSSRSKISIDEQEVAETVSSLISVSPSR